jgi:hypothetical protein
LDFISLPSTGAAVCFGIACIREQLATSRFLSQGYASQRMSFLHDYSLD